MRAGSDTIWDFLEAALTKSNGRCVQQPTTVSLTLARQLFLRAERRKIFDTNKQNMMSFHGRGSDSSCCFTVNLHYHHRHYHHLFPTSDDSVNHSLLVIWRSLLQLQTGTGYLLSKFYGLFSLEKNTERVSK